MNYQIKACRDEHIVGLGIQTVHVEDSEAEYFGLYFPDSEGKMMWVSDHVSREDAELCGVETISTLASYVAASTVPSMNKLLKTANKGYPEEVMVMLEQLKFAASGNYLELTTRQFAKAVIADWDKNRAKT